MAVIYVESCSNVLLDICCLCCQYSWLLFVMILVD